MKVNTFWFWLILVLIVVLLFKIVISVLKFVAAFAIHYWFITIPVLIYFVLVKTPPAKETDKDIVDAEFKVLDEDEDEGK
ncbi:MAG: hypothetical protein K9N06_07600 [Candidatus Cloacimonetes bacterium]|nr:hypothetical protein [Candidatus Cloacimonadota bacterium]